MNTIGIIPARGGSKGIPKKNIKLLNGKPLIVYTIEAASASDISRVVVSTDCEEIAEVSDRYGAEVVLRPAHLGQDNTPTLPVLQYTISCLKNRYDSIITLQPTSPLRTAEDINLAMSTFYDDKQADSLVSVVEVPHNYTPDKLMEFHGQYLSLKKRMVRRQEVPIMYARNGAAIYITKMEKLCEYILGGKIVPYFMSKSKSFDIDDAEDWDIIERLIK